jgi:hypothetical protein
LALTAWLKPRPFKSNLNWRFSAACEAVTEKQPVIAAVNRCANQKQERSRVFSNLQETVEAKGRIAGYPRTRPE